ncbi:nucleoid-associated protein [Paramaledivibacter caminithermalis]|jgi:hypothetical protein|uniref:Nucleoid-associated protein YejK n=1 Tax=Paramaledivibacter caminithermalis (strain DSM 15212 / CIP 107654 / DViRD3) TaxID=1121301 RepID=A0A1M6K164_PARC5|nr:nucleoid-associated protein [Paramaledivibacter caminithermalis]SHJ52657.1 hypothetical protein SAMN02745912_00207 [Paramaledivibacter caminithermalis DSM 15212]
MDDNIIIKKSIIHVLDASVGIPVLSDLEYDLEPEIKDYLKKHIVKFFKDIDLKRVYFNNENNRIKTNCLRLKNQENDFIQISKNIASIIHGFINENPDIPSADLICILFKVDDVDYLGIFKFNYKESYIHFIAESQKGRDIKIIKQRTALPLSTQKIDEGIIINMDDFSILLKEKKYDIDGEKQFYLSSRILQSTEVLSDKEKIDIINKASKQVVKKYCNDDLTKIAEIRNAMAQNVEDSNIINIEEVGDKVFGHNIEMKRIYTEEIEKYGLKDKIINVSENLEKRVVKKQRLVTDDGIEIKVPASFLSRQDKIELISNIDGTISIILKNIREIEDK